MAANRRYLETLAAVPDPGQLKGQIQTIGRRAKTESGSYRALNPASKDDVGLLAVVMRGEFTLRGFRNADVREQLNGLRPADETEHRRQSHRTGRLHRPSPARQQHALQPHLKTCAQYAQMLSRKNLRI